MTEQNMTHIAAGQAELGCRSLLLMPVIEGHTLDPDDVSGFLAGRLSAVEDEHVHETAQDKRLS